MFLFTRGKGVADLSPSVSCGLELGRTRVPAAPQCGRSRALARAHTPAKVGLAACSFLVGTGSRPSIRSQQAPVPVENFGNGRRSFRGLKQPRDLIEPFHSPRPGGPPWTYPPRTGLSRSVVKKGSRSLSAYCMHTVYIWQSVPCRAYLSLLCHLLLALRHASRNFYTVTPKVPYTVQSA